MKYCQTNMLCEFGSFCDFSVFYNDYLVITMISG